jgi:hypothetical protein
VFPINPLWRAQFLSNIDAIRRDDYPCLEDDFGCYDEIITVKIMTNAHKAEVDLLFLFAGGSLLSPVPAQR